MKEEEIQKLLKTRDIREFYDAYYEIIPQGGVELREIDKRLVEKEKELIRKTPKELTVEYGVDVKKIK